MAIPAWETGIALVNPNGRGKDAGEELFDKLTGGISMIIWARWKYVLITAILAVTGCAEFNLKSASPEVKTFFVAGQEADLLGTQPDSCGAVDLSAYSHLAGVKYPPTPAVDVLNQPPTRPYKSFAVLEYESSVNPASGAVMEGLKGKAREIGADAIIICQPGVQGLPGLPPSSKMQAVAIKYKLTGGSS